MIQKPACKILIFYDIKTETYDQYYRYLLGEFTPSVQQMGLRLDYIWQVVYGNYPTRQIEFVCRTRDLSRRILTSPRWQDLEDRLKSYTVNYERKLVKFEDRFQF